MRLPWLFSVYVHYHIFSHQKQSVHKRCCLAHLCHDLMWRKGQLLLSFIRNETTEYRNKKWLMKILCFIGIICDIRNVVSLYVKKVINCDTFMIIATKSTMFEHWTGVYKIIATFILSVSTWFWLLPYIAIYIMLSSDQII